MTRKNNRIVSNRLWRPLILVAMSMSLLLLTACGGNEPTEGLSPAQLAEGKALYEANCAACHGMNGEGEENWQEPNDDGTFRAPPHDSTGHTWHHPDQLLLQITTKGGKGLNSRMPAFEEKLTEEEIELVLEYIKTFWVPEHRQSQADVTERIKEAEANQ
ncbi:MAG: c-type cytochrome [Ardenticatenaceae bacterium]